MRYKNKEETDKNIKKFLYILFVLLFVGNIAAQPDDDEAAFSDAPTLTDLLYKLYKYPKEVKNRNFIEADWGNGIPYIQPETCDEHFAPVYPLQFKYGFSRINPYMPVEDRFYNAGEYIAIENITSHFHPKDWKQDGNTVDIWRFVAGYTNGWGYIFKRRHFAFNHTSFLGWARSDIELPSLNSNNQKVLNIYDEEYKFVNGFVASVNIETFTDLYLNVEYSKSITMPSFNFFKWFPGIFAELLMQRTLDAFGEHLLKAEPVLFPIANFVLKNSISFLLYELRRNNMFVPFPSNAPLNVYSFSIGLKLVF